MNLMLKSKLISHEWFFETTNNFHSRIKGNEIFAVTSKNPPFTLCNHRKFKINENKSVSVAYFSEILLILIWRIVAFRHFKPNKCDSNGTGNTIIFGIYSIQTMPPRTNLNDPAKYDLILIFI